MAACRAAPVAPSMRRLAPLTCAASSEARKATAAAMSSPVANVPLGVGRARGVVAGHARQRVARAERVDADAVRRALGAQQLGDRDDAGLDGGVGRNAVRAADGRVGGDHHHRSPALSAHRGEERAGVAERRGEVDLDEPVELSSLVSASGPRTRMPAFATSRSTRAEALERKRDRRVAGSAVAGVGAAEARPRRRARAPRPRASSRPQKQTS